MPDDFASANAVSDAAHTARPARFPARYALPFLLTVALFAVLVGYQIYVTHQSARGAAADDVKNLALVLESKLQSDFSAAERSVSKMAVEVEPEAMRRASVPRFTHRISARLRVLTADVPSASGIRVFDAEGNRLYSSVENEFDYNVGDRPFFRQLKADLAHTVVLSEVLTGRYSGRPTLFVAKAVRDARGNFLGSVNAAIDLSVLYRYFRGIDLGAGGSIALRRLDNGATVVRFPGPMEVDNKPGPDLPLRNAILAGAQAGIAEMESFSDGLRRLYAYRPVGAFPLYVVVGRAQSDYLAGWRRNAGALLAASLLFVAILALVFVRLAREASQRDRSEARLRESEQRLRHLIADNNAPILQIDLQSGRILDANAAALRFYGWTHEQICARTLRQIETVDTPDTPEPPAPDRAGDAAGEPPLEHAVRAHRIAGGRTRMVEVHSTPLRFGERALLVCIVFDITDRMRAEEQILALLREQKAILNSGLVGFAKVKQRKYVWVNETFARMLGYTPDEMIGQSTRITFASYREWEETGARMYARVLSGGITQNERQWLRKDGSLVWIDSSGGLLYPGSEESIWVYADIEQRMNLRQALARREAQLREAQQIAQLGSLEIDLVARKAYWSEEMYRIHGLDPAQPAPDRAAYLALVHPEDRARTAAAYIEALRSGAELDLTHRIVRKDGEIRHLHARGAARHAADGKPVRVLGVCQDVTAEVRQQQALAESEARFRHLTSISADWYWEQDENLRFTYVSSGASAQMAAVGDYLGKTRWELPYVDMDAQVIRDNEAKLAAREPFKGLVVKRRGADGGVLYAELSGEPVFDDTGAFKGYRGVGREITDRVRSEEALRAFDAIMNTSAAARAEILEQALRDAKARP